LVIAGLVIAGIGVAWLLAPSWLGRLPGDIVIERTNSRFYFPITTCIITSLLLSGWAGDYLGFGLMGSFLVSFLGSAVGIVVAWKVQTDYLT
jgi:hypothetical protein